MAYQVNPENSSNDLKTSLTLLQPPVNEKDGHNNCISRHNYHQNRSNKSLKAFNSSVGEYFWNDIVLSALVCN